MHRRLAAMTACVWLLVGCANSAPSAQPAAPSETPSETAASVANPDQRFPDIVDAAVSGDACGYTFDVTVSSPYDTPQRYADGWRVLGPGGEVYGQHQLTHDHASEQPFTRTQSGVHIPDGVTWSPSRAGTRPTGTAGLPSTSSYPRADGAGGSTCRLPAQLPTTNRPR